MNINNLPEPFEVVKFNAGLHEYNISTKYKSILVITYGGGAGGGGGYSRSSGFGGGGSGGEGSLPVTQFVPVHLIPKNLRIEVGSGGFGGAAGAVGSLGGRTVITTVSYSNTYTWLGRSFGDPFYRNPGNPGTASANGGPPSTGNVGVQNFLGPSYIMGQSGAKNGSGGTSVASPLTISTFFRQTTDGVMGGQVDSTPTALAGVGLTVTATAKYFKNYSASGGTASSVTSGGNGIDGPTVWTGKYGLIPYSLSGTGGGASTAGVGGNGGNGGIGSGGGGGGSGITGGTGGRGGDGIAILVLW